MGNGEWGKAKEKCQNCVKIVEIFGSKSTIVLYLQCSIEVAHYNKQ